MNTSNVTHAVWAIAMQFIGTLLTGNVWAGALFAIGFYIGREHAQQEYKYAKDVTTLKWYAGFTGWSKDKWLDVITPLVAVFIIGGIATVWK